MAGSFAKIYGALPVWVTAPTILPSDASDRKR